VDERDDDQPVHRSPVRRHDVADRRRAVPDGASADRGDCGDHRRLSVLCAAPVRGYVLGRVRQVVAPGRRTLWQLLSGFAQATVVGDGEHRRAPHPSPVQSCALLPAAGADPRLSRTAGCEADHAAQELRADQTEALGFRP